MRCTLPVAPLLLSVLLGLLCSTSALAAVAAPAAPAAAVPSAHAQRLQHVQDLIHDMEFREKQLAALNSQQQQQASPVILTDESPSLQYAPGVTAATAGAAAAAMEQEQAEAVQQPQQQPQQQPVPQQQQPRPQQAQAQQQPAAQPASQPQQQQQQQQQRSVSWAAGGNGGPPWPSVYANPANAPARTVTPVQNTAIAAGEQPDTNQLMASLRVETPADTLNKVHELTDRIQDMTQALASVHSKVSGQVVHQTQHHSLWNQWMNTPFAGTVPYPPALPAGWVSHNPQPLPYPNPPEDGTMTIPTPDAEAVAGGDDDGDAEKDAQRLMMEEQQAEQEEQQVEQEHEQEHQQHEALKAVQERVEAAAAQVIAEERRLAVARAQQAATEAALRKEKERIRAREHAEQLREAEEQRLKVGGAPAPAVHTVATTVTTNAVAVPADHRHDVEVVHSLKDCTHPTACGQQVEQQTEQQPANEQEQQQQRKREQLQDQVLNRDHHHTHTVHKTKPAHEQEEEEEEEKQEDTQDEHKGNRTSSTPRSRRGLLDRPGDKKEDAKAGKHSRKGDHRISHRDADGKDDDKNNKEQESQEDEESEGGELDGESSSGSESSSGDGEGDDYADDDVDDDGWSVTDEGEWGGDAAGDVDRQEGRISAMLSQDERQLGIASDIIKASEHDRRQLRMEWRVKHATDTNDVAHKHKHMNQGDEGAAAETDKHSPTAVHEQEQQQQPETAAREQIRRELDEFQHLPAANPPNDLRRMRDAFHDQQNELGTQAARMAQETKKLERELDLAREAEPSSRNQPFSVASEHHRTHLYLHVTPEKEQQWREEMERLDRMLQQARDRSRRLDRVDLRMAALERQLEVEQALFKEKKQVQKSEEETEQLAHDVVTQREQLHSVVTAAQEQQEQQQTMSDLLHHQRVNEESRKMRLYDAQANKLHARAVQEQDEAEVNRALSESGGGAAAMSPSDVDLKHAFEHELAEANAYESPTQTLQRMHHTRRLVNTAAAQLGLNPLGPLKAPQALPVADTEQQQQQDDDDDDEQAERDAAALQQDFAGGDDFNDFDSANDVSDAEQQRDYAHPAAAKKLPFPSPASAVVRAQGKIAQLAQRTMQNPARIAATGSRS